VNQAAARGRARQQVQPESVTFIQRFCSALNLHVHYHIVFLEGVYLDRTAQGLKPRFVRSEPSTDADIADVVQTISRRVIRKLRHLGYLEAGSNDAVATGYDPLLSEAPELARTLAASVMQRIAFGERAGQPVRRIGSGFGYEGESPALTGPRCASVHGFSLHAHTQVPAHRRDQLERLLRYTARGAVALERLEEAANGELVYRFTKPWSDGTTGITLSPLELLEKLAALVPLLRVHLVRYGGCLAPHSRLLPTSQGTRRPLGLPAREDKSVAQAVARLLEAIDEQACCDASSGCRPGRSPHPARHDVRQGLLGNRMGQVIDGDISSFCDNVPHDTL
jgi:Putative transposase